jgi:hypothetical protein
VEGERGGSKNEEGEEEGEDEEGGGQATYMRTAPRAPE